MKKIFIILISVMMLLPMTVFADFPIVTFHANHNVFVGGYKELYLNIASPYESKPLDEITIEYDTNYFSISKSDISIYKCGHNLTNHEAMNISISDGKVSIKSNGNIEITNCFGGSNFEIYLNFLALKAGKSTINMSGSYSFSTLGEQNVESEIVEQKCSETSNQECPNPIEEKNFIKDNAIVLMAACGVVGVLLGFVFFHKPVKKNESTQVENQKESEDKK